MEDIISKEERRGVYVLLIMSLVSWGFIGFGNVVFRFIAWISMGLIGFSLWRIIEGIFSRIDERGNK